MENNDEDLENKKTENKEISAEEALNELEGKSNKEQSKKEIKQLRNILLGLGIFVIVLLLAVFFINSIRSFEYKNTKFDIVREGNLILYNTKIALVNEKGEQYMNYNFFLRNDPRKLNVDFNGELKIEKLAVINSEEEFNCDGDGIIAVANLNQLYQMIGTKVMRDENATCDSEGRYMYINLKSGDKTPAEGGKTKIEQTGNACYDIIINNCEILPATERFMVETFVKING